MADSRLKTILGHLNGKNVVSFLFVLQLFEINNYHESLIGFKT